MASDQAADGAGDDGVSADRVAEEFAGHDGAGVREDADEAECSADAEREAEQGCSGAAEGRADEKERGDFAAAEALTDAEH